MQIVTGIIYVLRSQFVCRGVIYESENYRMAWRGKKLNRQLPFCRACCHFSCNVDRCVVGR